MNTDLNKLLLNNCIKRSIVQISTKKILINIEIIYVILFEKLSIFLMILKCFVYYALPNIVYTKD